MESGLSSPGTRFAALTQQTKTESDRRTAATFLFYHSL
jgi:hypothetical protein